VLDLDEDGIIRYSIRLTLLVAMKCNIFTRNKDKEWIYNRQISSLLKI